MYLVYASTLLSYHKLYPSEIKLFPKKIVLSSITAIRLKLLEMANETAPTQPPRAGRLYPINPGIERSYGAYGTLSHIRGSITITHTETGFRAPGGQPCPARAEPRKFTSWSYLGARLLGQGSARKSLRDLGFRFFPKATSDPIPKSGVKPGNVDDIRGTGLRPVNAPSGSRRRWRCGAGGCLRS